MCTRSNVGYSEWERFSDVEDGWSIVEDSRKQNFLLVFGVKDSTSLVEFGIACGDIGLDWIVSRACIRRLGNHMRINVKEKFSRLLTREYISGLSRLMRVKCGWRCVYDKLHVDASNVNKTCDNMRLSSRYSVLQDEDCLQYVGAPEILGGSPICEVGQISESVTGVKRRGLGIGAWNFQGLCSDRKALEIGEVLSQNYIDIISSEESWELDSSKIYVPGYKSFGKPREVIKGKRGEGGVDF